jgi:hypothetical protein
VKARAANRAANRRASSRVRNRGGTRQDFTIAYGMATQFLPPLDGIENRDAVRRDRLISLKENSDLHPSSCA